MKRRRIRLYSYHTFLVIPFIVLFLYGYNINQTSPWMTYRTLLYGTILSVLLFAAFYIVIRKRLKTGVFVTVLLFGLFQYGVLYEFFESLYYNGSWPFKNIHRYLLTSYGVAFLAFLVFIKRSKHDFIRINYFLNILVIILIGYNLVRINSRHFYPAVPKLLEKSVPGQKPAGDIYYIVLDGYASNQVLKKYYNFSNTEFTTALKKVNFNFADSAFANYYYTSLSLGATLNMQYHKKGEVNERLKDNQVFATLKDHGYRIYHMFSGYAVTSSFKNADSTINIEGPNEFEKSLLKYTILRLDDLIGLFAHQRLQSQFIKMMDMAEIKSTPKFCFMHFVAPHPPFIFHRNGKIRTKHQFAENSWEPREFYIDQLVYVNKQISALIYRIISHNPTATIIIQSDHGPWITDDSREKVFEARSGILYAWHAPQGVTIPNSTSPVNTFRHLFNGLFGSHMEILPDLYSGRQELMTDPVLNKKVNH